MNALVDLTTAFQDEIPNYRLNDESIFSSLGVRRRVRVVTPRSVWARELEERFDELTSLPKGWDGYDGIPVSFNCAQFAANLIESLFVQGVPAPQLVPGADGSLQLEWHVNQYDLEVDVLAPYEVVATRYNYATEEENEIDIQADFTELASWVQELGETRHQQQNKA